MQKARLIVGICPFATDDFKWADPVIVEPKAERLLLFTGKGNEGGRWA